MIGQLTGQPLPVHQIEPSRIHTLSDHGNSTAYGRSPAEQEADQRRTVPLNETHARKPAQALRKLHVYAQRNQAERLFLYNKTTLLSLLNDMLTHGELSVCKR